MTSPQQAWCGDLHSSATLTGRHCLCKALTLLSFCSGVDRSSLLSSHVTFLKQQKTGKQVQQHAGTVDLPPAASEAHQGTATPGATELHC